MNYLYIFQEGEASEVVSVVAREIITLVGDLIESRSWQGVRIMPAAARRSDSSM